MSKYSEVNETNEIIFADQVADADLERVVNVKVLGDNRQKDIFKVVKANPIVKHMTNEDVIIIVNETIFDGLETDQKRLVADEAVTYIGYDFEKDKLTISKPDLTTFKGIIRKYSFETYERLNESITSLYDAKKNAEAND